MNEPLFCPRCKAPVEEPDNYCRVCGRSLKPGRGFLFTHSGIILMSLILGPFALPLVWTSKVISTAAKWIYTLLLGVCALYLCKAFYNIYLLLQDATQMLLGGQL